MKKIKNILAVAILSLIVTSCTVTVPVAVSNAPIGGKKGVSESFVIFGTIYLNSEYGVKDAAKNGSITGAIGAIDEKTTDYVVFSKKELIVLSK